MRKICFVLAIFVLLAGVSLGRISVSDEEGIKAATLDYIEGWYEGNPERMERALHKELAKRGVFINKKSGETIIRPVSAEQMVKFTKAGAGKKPKDQWGIELTIR